MQSYSAKAAELEKTWILLDAEGVVVGRLAAFVATRLRGKHKPRYTPHMDCGDGVIITNARKAVFTGKKAKDKIYHRHTGYPGGIRETTPEKILKSGQPQRVLLQAVRRMMPDGPLAREQMRSLRIYPDADHPHAAQAPEIVDFRAANPKNARQPA